MDNQKNSSSTLPSSDHHSSPSLPQEFSRVAPEITPTQEQTKDEPLFAIDIEQPAQPVIQQFAGVMPPAADSLSQPHIAQKTPLNSFPLVQSYPPLDPPSYVSAKHRPPMIQPIPPSSQAPPFYPDPQTAPLVQEHTIADHSLPNTVADYSLEESSEANTPPTAGNQAVFYAGTVALLLLGVYGLYHIFYFILQEFPIFEQALADAQIERESINQLGLKVGLMILATAMSFFFAVQMTLFHHRMKNALTIALPFLVCIISFFILQYAQSLSVVVVE